MISVKHPVVPQDTDRMPPSVPYIIGNEAAERFSFYGMRTILVVFMTQFLKNRSGQLDVMTEEQAKVWFHLFVFGVYFLPVFGAILSDAFLGKYWTIIGLSIIYCLGHLSLAIDDTRAGLAVGLVLIALGAGGIKPCVSANVGDQFGARNQHLLPKIFGWFYFSINLGSFFSTMLTPWLLDEYGPRVAFGVPGVLMFIATVIFWLGRNQYVRVPPAGMGFVREIFSREGLIGIARLVPVFAAVAIFWSLWDQTGSAWVLQAKQMNLHWLGFDWRPAQVQAANPILILVIIPLCSYVLYPAIDRVFKLTALRKIGIGLFLTVPAFLITSLIETKIAVGQHPSISWQFAAFVVISLAEVMVSVTCLEFSYTQSPPELKSLIMSFYLLSIAGGNLFTSIVNKVIQNPDGTVKLQSAAYFNFFAALMFVTALLFIFVAATYRGRSQPPARATPQSAPGP